MPAKGYSHNVVPRNDQGWFARGRKAHDATLPGQRRRHIKVPLGIEGDTLRSAETTIKRGNFSGWADAVDLVETRGRRTADVEAVIGPKSQVVSGDTGLQRGEHKNLALPIDLKDRTTSVADI